jgi:hypothetical protein
MITFLFAIECLPFSKNSEDGRDIFLPAMVEKKYMDGLKTLSRNCFFSALINSGAIKHVYANSPSFPENSCALAANAFIVMQNRPLAAGNKKLRRPPGRGKSRLEVVDAVAPDRYSVASGGEDARTKCDE